MSKSVGQVFGGVVGAVGGFFLGGGFAGAARGFLIGSSIGGMIDPPPGPDLKGPTLEDKSFNSAAYGVSLATLHGTIAHTGSIIYLENNEYKAVAKKQKTGGKGGGSKGSYTTTTYFATFAVAIGEAMPGSVIRRIWAGGKLIYSVGETVDSDSLLQSANNAEGWHYYNGTQTEPDSRMEAVLGVGNCPSYEGTAYIIFYDFDLTDYGNGLQGCPIKIEVIADFEAENDEQPFQKVFEAVTNYPAYVYHHVHGWLENGIYIRSLTVDGAMFIATGLSWGESVATYTRFNTVTGWEKYFSDPYSGEILTWPGLTFSDDLNWHMYDPTAGALPNVSLGWAAYGWATSGGMRMTFGSRLHTNSGLDWGDEAVCGAAYGDGNFYIINNHHIIKLSTSGVILLSRPTDLMTGGTYYRLWYDGGFLYRLGLGGGTSLRMFVYDAVTLDTLNIYQFGHAINNGVESQLQFAVYGAIVVVGWANRYGVDGGEFHYEQWRIKDFNTAQKISLDKIVGRHMSAAGVAPEFRDLTALENDYVAGYKITEAGSARGKIGPLQIAYLFDLIEDGYTLKAVKRGGNSIATIPLSECDARAAGDSPGALVRRDRETESQLPSRYSIAYIDYNREYDTSTQYADFPSRSVSERNQQLAIVLSADDAAKLVDVLINLAWAERDSYEFSWPQKYLYLKPSNVVTAEVAAGVWVVVRISSITYTADQRVQVSARRAEPALYQSGAVGVAVTPPSENIPKIVTPNLIIMDMAAVNDATTTMGFGVAIWAGENWGGGNLLRSIDAGQTYDAIQGFSSSCTVARGVSWLGDGDYFVIDRSSELELSFGAGDFFSITEEQMLTGKHYCAYGAPGRWEILQYAVANVTNSSTVILSTFVRGLFGTEWAGALHTAGDYFVLLDDPDNAFIGADAVALNSPRKFKAVSTAQDAQLVNEIDFTYRGVNLKPLSPVNVLGTLVDEVWTISCAPRTRMASNQWSTGIAAPIGEVALLFEFEIYDGAVFKKTYQSNTETFVYSAANQMTDFGYLPASLTVKIYQISAVIGRGYVAQSQLSGVSDPFLSSVVLLMHCNGVDASTTFIDSALSPKTVVASGNVKMSVAQFKNGNASAIFDGSGDYLSIASHSDFGFGLGDFTAECWVYLPALPALNMAMMVFDFRATAANGQAAFLYIKNVSGVTSICYSCSYGNAYQEGATTVGISAGSWHHCAWVRRSGVIYLYINGVRLLNSAGSASDAGSYSFGTARPLVIGWGNSGTGTAFAGYIDEIRITKACRYIENFTPPSQQLPDPI